MASSRRRCETAAAVDPQVLLRSACFAAIVFLASSCSAGPATNDIDSDVPSSNDAAFSDADVREGSDVGPTKAVREFSDDERRRLQSQLDAAVESIGLPGAAMGAMRVETAELWAGSSGFVDPAKTERWEPDRQFRIGSVTKTFTTAVVMQLIAEGTVSLDDDLERWVPGYYDGVGVQVRHLIGNTSGIVSYNYVGSFDDSRPWTPDELVQWAVDHEPELRFEPGTQWEYSNTNFVLAGLVIEAATGATYEHEVRTRLFEPLGLGDTYVAGAGDDNPRVVRSFGLDGTQRTADPSFGWAAGAIVSTPRDLACWGAALYGGRVLEPESLALMTAPNVTYDDGMQYGYGTFIESDGSNTIFGHTGGIGGWLTYLYFWEAESTVVVAMSNVLETDLRHLSAYGWSVVLDFDYP